MNVYVASKSKHGAMWLDLREGWAERGIYVVSTWINEWAPGASGSMSDLWVRCIDEATICDLLICYVEQDETLKGAYIEIGAALACGNDVYVWRVGDWKTADGDRLGSWANHPRVTMVESPDEAFAIWARRNVARDDLL